MTLNEKIPGQTAESTGYLAESAVCRAKLLALGLTRGVRLKLVNVAPLGDPLGLVAYGFHL